jgi:hypothetical protein
MLQCCENGSLAIISPMNKICGIKHCNEVVSTPALYLGGPKLVLNLRRAILTEVFCDFSQSLKANPLIGPHHF